MDEALWGAANSKKLTHLRRGLGGQKSAEAIQSLITALRKYPTNAELLKIIPG
jgi:transcription termination factor Rho